MDVFKSVGNFFRGAFGGGESDEEKKRKQQQAQQQKQQPKPVKVPQPFATPQAPAAKPVTPKPVVAPVPKPNPVPVPAPLPAVPVAPVVKPENHDITTKTAPKDTLKQFNQSDLGTQRKMREQIKRTTDDPVVTKEDLDKVQHARATLKLLDEQGQKKGGNFGTFLEDTGAAIKEGFTKPTQVLGEGLAAATGGIKAAQDESNSISVGMEQAGRDYKAGHLSLKEYQDRMKQYSDRRAVNDYKMNRNVEVTDPAKQAGAFVEAASNLPVGLGAKAAVTEGAKAAEPLLKRIISSAIENGVPAGIGNAASAFREDGKDAKPGDVASRLATGLGFGAALGTGGTLVGRGAGKVVDRFGRETAGDAAAAQAPATSRGSLGLVNELDDAVEKANPELVAAANSETGSALERRQAQDKLEQIKRDNVQPDPGDADNTPAIIHRDNINRIITSAEVNFTRYVNDNPDLSPGQIEEARDKTRELTENLIKDLQDKRLKQVTGQEPEAAPAPTAEPAVSQPITSPAQGDAVPKQSADPEVAANDAYAQQYNSTADMTDEVLKRAGIENVNDGAKESTLAKVLYKARGGDVTNLYRTGVNKIRDALGDVQYKMASSGNVFASAPNKIASLIFNNAGIKDGIRQIVRVRNDMQTAASDAVKRLHDSIGEKMANADLPSEAVNQQLDQLFESPEFITRRYGEDVPKLSLDQLDPTVRGIAEDLIGVNKMRNLALFKQGRITADEYAQFSDGMHSPRLYDFETENIGTKGGGNKLVDTSSTIKRKGLDKISDETFEKLIDSPAQRMLIRLEMALRSNASHDALKSLDEAGMLSDTPIDSSFSQLEGPRWGQYQGKYLYNPLKGQLSDTTVFNSRAGETIGDLIDQYKQSPLGAADRFFKKTKTTLSPGTFLGNVTSNPILFNGAAGVDPLTQSLGMAKAGVDLARHRGGATFDPSIYEAQKYGVFSSDTGKQITGDNNPELGLLKKDKNLAQKAAGLPTALYGSVDDAAKLSLWRRLRSRGIEPEEAARRVALGTQDYNNAGRLVQLLADSPIMGKPFARFAPELVRLVKNNVVYNPVSMVAGVGALAMVQNQLSDAAGETPEQREAREGAMGQTTLPGTSWLNKLMGGPDRNVSLNFPVGDAAINAARSLGLNFPIDDSGDPNMALIKQLVPFTIPTRKNAQGDTVFAPEEVFSSLALSPLAQQIANRDFMGRSITDPDNKTYFEGANGGDVKKYAGDPGIGEQILNRLRAGYMSYAPLANETDAVASAAAGAKDFYGKTRDVPQAIGRMFGVKVEGNDQAAREKRQETQDYFENDQAQTQQFLRDNPDLTDSYFKLKNPTRTRPEDVNDPGTKVSDLVSPEKWSIINSDTSGRLFNFLKSQATQDYQKDGKPMDPVFLLDENQSRYVADLRSRPTGDDEEAKDILRATSPWYYNYEQAYFKYLDSNTQFYKDNPASGGAKDNPRVAAYSEASKPVEQPDIVKQYYQAKVTDPDAAKTFYDNNKDTLSKAFDTYAVEKLKRINTLRKIEGYQPITLDTYKNDTFGFNAKGGGGFGGGGGYTDNSTNSVGRVTSFLGDIKGFQGNPVEAQAAPNTNNIFASLVAGGGGSRSKPKLGASSRGQ